MRPFFLYSVAAAAVVLTACSGAMGTQGVPTARLAPAASPTITMKVIGGRPDASCPKSYGACVTVSADTPGSILLCEGSCGPVGYQWSSTFVRRKTRTPFGKFSATFDPNPGDPVTDTISEVRHVKPSQGKYKWLQLVKVCNGGCSTGYVAIATE